MASTVDWQRQLVAALLARPAVLGEGPADCIETHFSWVVLTRRRAFKLKKALDRPWLGHATADDRRRACQSEVHLNRRLAADVYLGVIGIRARATGDLQRIEAGRRGADEYLVVMRRLDAGQTLDARLREGRVEPADLDALMRRLSDFYRALPPERLPAGATWRAMQAQIASHIEELRHHPATPARRRLGDLGEALQRLGGELRALIEERIRTGHVREVHGDLRPEHIYLEAEPVIIDCLEFARSLRLQDPVEEIAFLSMECERLGDGATGEGIRARFRAAMADTAPAGLWHYHAARRALLWAVLAMRHDATPDSRGAHDWPGRAAGYLARIEHHLGCLGAGPDPA